MDIGFRYQTDKWSVKAEVLDGDDVYGSPTRSERVSYVDGAYRLGPKVEIVARHCAGESGYRDDILLLQLQVYAEK